MHRLTPPTHSPTARELEVQECLLQGKSNKEIAVKLGISDRTVKAHVKILLGKLGFSDRVELLAARLAEQIKRRAA
jgi:DNA-binding NarL/FixJ family response regulator